MRIVVGFFLPFLSLFINLQVLQGQMMGHQTAIDSLRKTAESLITSEGDLLSNPDEIQETVGEKNKSQLHSMICIPNGSISQTDIKPSVLDYELF